MRTGICTSDFEPMETEALFRKISDFGFGVVQFSFTSILEAGYEPTGEFEFPAEIADSTIELIKNCAKRYGIDIAAVNGTFNMAHPDAAIRKEGAERFKSFAHAVAKLGCGTISLCSGTRNRESLWKYHSGNDTKEAWDDMLCTVKNTVETAESLGLTLAVETEAANIIDTPEKARKLIDDVGSDSLKMIIDCANLFHAGKAHPQNVRPVMLHAFEYFGRDMVIAHGKDIAESDGINFCGTGDGIIDFVYFVQLLDKYGYKGDMFLHGIYEESKMPSCKTYFEKCLSEGSKK